MRPRWSVIATMADSSRANFRSASSLSDLLKASSASKGYPSVRGVSCGVLSLIVGKRLSTRRLRGGAFVARRAAELLEPVAQLVARDVQQFGRARLVAAAPAHGLPHQRVLDLFERDALGRELEEESRLGCRVRGGGLPGAPRQVARQVLGGDELAVFEDERALDDVAQLADVAGPRV